MLISATAALHAGPDAPILYRGAWSSILPQIAEDGFAGVELHLTDSRQIDRDALHTLLDRHGLKLTSIGTGSAYGALGYNLVDKDPDIRRKTIAHLEEHMKTLAPWHGVVIVGLIAGRSADCGAPLPIQKQRLAASLQALDALAGLHGVRVGLEIMNRYESDFLHTISEGKAFLEEAGPLPHTCLHIDSVSMNIGERDIGAAIRAGGARIGHVHLADNDRWYPGHAHFHFEPMLRALLDIGYDGALALEQKPLPTTREAARLSLRYLGALLSVLP